MAGHDGEEPPAVRVRIALLKSEVATSTSSYREPERYGPRHCPGICLKAAISQSPMPRDPCPPACSRPSARRAPPLSCTSPRPEYPSSDAAQSRYSCAPWRTANETGTSTRNRRSARAKFPTYQPGRRDPGVRFSSTITTVMHADPPLRIVMSRSQRTTFMHERASRAAPVIRIWSRSGPCRGAQSACNGARHAALRLSPLSIRWGQGARRGTRSYTTSLPCTTAHSCSYRS